MPNDEASGIANTCWLGVGLFFKPHNGKLIEHPVRASPGNRLSSARILSACIFLALTTLISITSVGPVHGFRSDVTLDQESVTMNIRLQLTENITSLPLVDI